MNESSKILLAVGLGFIAGHILTIAILCWVPIGG